MLNHNQDIFFSGGGSKITINISVTFRNKQSETLMFKSLVMPYFIILLIYKLRSLYLTDNISIKLLNQLQFT